MKRASIEPRRLYAATGVDRVTVPSLVLDNALWDRLPRKRGVTFHPAPKRQRWSTTLDCDTGARRGILTVLPRSGTKHTEVTVQHLELLAVEAEDLNVPDGGAKAVSALRALVEEPLILDVVRVSKIIMPWDAYVSGDVSSEWLHTCPKCGESVAMNAASRLRAHPDGTGAPCPRSNTPLSKEERNNEQ
ncbi:hypothetical protein OG497_37730 [Streptomyces sp. NBC_01242]|uniref:hypothetical protein n=1 Tax=Streptomyces sp. NBC_01242 TaxID=2903795 RepID=UPI00224C97BB|nr:hypothetical protein [Streptomyces sp. NBC_01242]MCX4799599.1 hypothetical protein [Streptomyces sp. NBC_01242]